MNTALNTKHTPEGIICTLPEGMPFGVITYGDGLSRWGAKPLRFPAQTFRSLEGAEFYMLACAAEDAEIMREVNTRLNLAEQGEDVQALCGDASPEATARIREIIRADLPADLRDELQPL